MKKLKPSVVKDEKRRLCGSKSRLELYRNIYALTAVATVHIGKRKEYMP